jgi:plasmid stability protein
MATLTIRKLDDALVRRLKIRAAQNGRSAEAEARAILDDALVVTSSTSQDFWADADKLRERLRGLVTGDSTDIIREERDRRAGLRG